MLTLIFSRSRQWEEKEKHKKKSLNHDGVEIVGDENTLMPKR